ncbi:hypothetical protein FLGE108171_14565 [Flavobacterium gelidilacus]|uniref:hypothetical protein n=1 Tax=Flavobacterium gelidilacus TaxID=206041 RepID=UPI00041E5835|nr:hypothetical protein [Flavobacterium gelidilacus]
MSVTIDDYIRSIKEEIIIARQNDLKGFLVKPSPAQLRNLCLLLFEEGLNNNDNVIFESFFSATKEDDLKKKIENVDIDKFRPIRNLIEGSIESPSIINLEMVAILISFKKRPYKNYSKGYEVEKKNWEVKNEISPKTFDEESIQLIHKKSKLKKMMFGGLGLVAISAVGIIGNSYNSKNDFQCMQWQIDHYEKVDCEMKNVLGTFSANHIEVINKKAIDLKKINVTPETTFFYKNKAAIYYYKVNDSVVEYYNGPGFHPLVEKPLKPITKYIIKKYIKK